MSPDQAAAELLTELGDGSHILKTHSESYKKYRRNKADLQEIYISLVLLSEKLKQGVADTELQGWYPRVSEPAHHTPSRPDEGFMFSWDHGYLGFFIHKDEGDIQYTYKGEPSVHIARMTGETLAEAATRLVFNCLRPYYNAHLFQGGGLV